VVENVSMPRWLHHPIQQIRYWSNSPFAVIPRPLEARYAALVSISDSSEGRLSGPCSKRALLTKLLPAINAARPAMIVVDLALTGEDTSDSCASDAPETSALISGIETAAKTTPLVIGQATISLDEMTDDKATQLRERGFGENDLLLRKPMSVSPETSNVSFGLIRFNQDLEKVPVLWFAHQDEISGAKAVPALGFVAAQMYRSAFPEGLRRLQMLADARYHPVAAFLPQTDFATVNAIDVICRKPPQNHDWLNCTDPEAAGTSVTPQLHGRVVVIGISDNTNDLWATPVGRMPGYAVHANYIEALLDARAYRPLGFWLTCLLSLVWLVLVEMPFWILKNQLQKGLLFSVAVSIIILFLAKYVALVNFGLYISLFAPSVLLLGVSLLHVVAGRSEWGALSRGSYLSSVCVSGTFGAFPRPWAKCRADQCSKS
jgi:hypothetical protein